MVEKVAKLRSEKHASGVIVKGVDNIKIRLSRCCNPVPGDAIVGFITRGRGVSVHRADCSNIHVLNDSDGERFLDVEWDTGKKGTFLSEIQIRAIDRPRLLQDITGLYNDARLNAISLNLKINKDKVAIIDINFEINESKQLHELIKKLGKIEGVLDIYRTTK
jgi:GTP pyrophosphokinase